MLRPLHRRLVPCLGIDHDDVEGPPFTYTIGLYGLPHPELLILGVPPDIADGALNTLGERIRSGDQLTPGAVITLEPPLSPPSR